MKRAKTILAWLAVVGGSIVLAVCVALIAVDEPRPSGRTGAEAENLARSIEESVFVEDWERTRALRWNFDDRRRHLWDRERDVVRVRWDDNEVLLHEGAASGRAYVGGVEVTGADARALLERGNAYWVNDSYWLNPLAKLRDEGVTLSEVDGNLLVEYSSGGLTPGDAYLWIPSPDGPPRAWRTWVSILPVGGVEMSWEDWVELRTGAIVSTRHVLPFGLEIRIREVDGAETLAELVDGPDPFAPLFEH